MPGYPLLEGTGVDRLVISRAAIPAQAGDLDRGVPLRAKVKLDQSSKRRLIAVVFGKTLTHVYRCVAEDNTEGWSVHLLDDRAALPGRKPVQNPRGLGDPQRRLLGTEPVHSAAAVEKIDHLAGELREHQSGDQHHQGAAEKRPRQEFHASSRSTAAAST